jgi:hypothetical protein
MFFKSKIMQIYLNMIFSLFKKNMRLEKFKWLTIYLLNFKNNE